MKTNKYGLVGTIYLFIIFVCFLFIYYSLDKLQYLVHRVHTMFIFCLHLPIVFFLSNRNV